MIHLPLRYGCESRRSQTYPFAIKEFSLHSTIFPCYSSLLYGFAIIIPSIDKCVSVNNRHPDEPTPVSYSCLHNSGTESSPDTQGWGHGIVCTCPSRASGMQDWVA